MHKHNYGFDSSYLTVILIGNLSWNSTDDTLLQVCLSLRQLAFLAHVVSLQCPFSILRLGPALSFPMILWLVALHLSRLRHPPGQCYCLKPFALLPNAPSWQ